MKVTFDILRRLLRMRAYEQTDKDRSKAEECTTPYMRQNIKINIGVGGLHGNQGY